MRHIKPSSCPCQLWVVPSNRNLATCLSQSTQHGTQRRKHVYTCTDYTVHNYSVNLGRIRPCIPACSCIWDETCGTAPTRTKRQHSLPVNATYGTPIQASAGPAHHKPRNSGSHPEISSHPTSRREPSFLAFRVPGHAQRLKLGTRDRSCSNINKL